MNDGLHGDGSEDDRQSGYGSAAGYQRVPPATVVENVQDIVVATTREVLKAMRIGNQGAAGGLN